LYLISDFTGGRAYLDRALAVVGHQPETADLRLTVLVNNASNLHAIGHPEPAERLIQEALILAEQIGSWRAPHVRVTAGTLFILSGRWDEALAVLEPADGKFDLFERPVRSGALAFIAAHGDDRARCAQLLADMADLPEPAGYMRGNAGCLYMARAVN